MRPDASHHPLQESSHAVACTAAPPFRNPIIADGADPWVCRWNDRFLYCFSGVGGIRLAAASRLEDLGNAPSVLVWEAPGEGPCSKNIWAPELHHAGGRWIIYFAADDGRNEHHRMFALEGQADTPFGPYRLAGKIADPSDKWAIDGTLLKFAGRLYFVWSGWEGDENGQQNLYIAAMSDPLRISSDRSLLSSPGHGWERAGGPPWVNEGPQALQRHGRTFLVFSAAASWRDDYCLGLLELVGTDPLDPASWSKLETPVFASSAEVVAPGHASFVRMADGRDVIVYHAAKRPGAGWDREVHAKVFHWTPDGFPVFGRPRR